MGGMTRQRERLEGSVGEVDVVVQQRVVDVSGNECESIESGSC